MSVKNEIIVVLGAGISGISASYHLKQKNINSIIYEKNSDWGGLCDNFIVNGFRFDKFIHLSFSENQYVNELFKKSTNYSIHKPESLNYYNGYWLKHPVQNNLYNLDIEEKIRVIKSFLSRKKYNFIGNYEKWLKSQYGTYFSENFPMLYTRKYWTVDAKELETEWVSGRMYVPNIDEVLRGAMLQNVSNVYYAKEMRYPKNGGYRSFLNYMATNLEIKCNKEVIEIDINKKKLKFNDNEIIDYDKIISTIPLPELCNIIKSVPDLVYKAANNLDYTSGVLVSLGFNKSNVPNSLWFYIYDEDIYPSRVYSPSIKSSNNVPPNCSSLQAEIYFSKYKPIKESLETIRDKTINQMISMGLFKEEDIILKDVRFEKYANVMFTKDIYTNRKIVHDYLDSIGILYAGRFGEWDYLWSDQSLLSGKKIVGNLI